MASFKHIHNAIGVLVLLAANPTFAEDRSQPATPEYENSDAFAPPTIVLVSEHDVMTDLKARIGNNQPFLADQAIVPEEPHLPQQPDVSQQPVHLVDASPEVTDEAVR